MNYYEKSHGRMQQGGLLKLNDQDLIPERGQMQGDVLGDLQRKKNASGGNALEYPLMG